MNNLIKLEYQLNLVNRKLKDIAKIVLKDVELTNHKEANLLQRETTDFIYYQKERVKILVKIDLEEHKNANSKI